MNISVVGIGKLGAPLMGVLADSGHTVIGVDVNRLAIDKINSGVAPVSEPGLSDLIERNREKISATSDFEEAVEKTDVTFVIVPTPSDNSGKFSNVHVEASLRNIAKGIIRKNRYHLVVVVSTVMPGSCELFINQMHEDGVDESHLGFCYSPEFIALGSVVSDMVYPDMVLIGQKDDRSGDILESVQLSYVNNAPSVKRLSIIDAEVAKISLNTYITTKITFANLLAEICENVPFANAADVLDAIGSDTRVGKKYLKPATPYGGPCFPRDTIAFSAFASEYYVDAMIPEAVDAVNTRQVQRIAKRAYELNSNQSLYSKKSIAILGLSYKPETSVTEQSAGISVANRLIEFGCDVVVFDPVVKSDSLLSTHARWASSSADAINQSHVAVVTTAWEEFSLIDPEDYLNVLFLDCWAIMKPGNNVIIAGQNTEKR